MDRPQQSAQQPGQRDMVFCHECENEWYRDEHGLTCPDCGSDFTEIIEPDHDPRADLLLPQGHDSDSSHDGMDRHPDDHHSWANIPDPDEGNINEFRWQPTGPGRFTLHGTFYRTIPPGGLAAGLGAREDPHNQNRNAGPHDGLTQNFMTMLQGILGNHRPQVQPAGSGAQQPGSQQQGDQQHGDLQQGEGRGEHAEGAQGNNFGGGPQVRVIHGGGPGHHFTYTSSVRLFPRDGNAPAHVEPVDDLNAILGAMFGTEAMGLGPNAQNRRPEDAHLPPFNPLAALFGHFLNPGGVHGDVVYSQEALDRVISQLMEQNASGNAPGPAPAEAIDALPKRKITIEDLGSDGKAECSICMDEVEVGEEVTVLPCSHWFHHQCVSMWLGEHDTCPHCRKGITKKDDANNNQSGAGGDHGNPSTGSSSHPSSPSHNYQAPGSFDSGSPPPSSQSRPPYEHSRSSSQGNNGGSSGGITGRLRGLFGGGSSSAH